MTASTLRGIAAVVLGCLVAAPSWAAGRVVEKGKRARFMISIGDRSPISGGVQETFRPVNELRENPDAPESYTFEDLGLSESERTLGLRFEYQWKWVTLFVESTYLGAKAVATAPEDLYIGVKEVYFNGQKYTYQQIPEGFTYEGNIDLYIVNPRLGVTPFDVNPGGKTEFVPWFLVGLYSMAGEFGVDAGPATGVVLFEFPPREYVVGGKSKGNAVAATPEIGLGGEVIFRLGERARLTWQSNYTIFDFKGSTSDIGVNARIEKDVSLDFTSFDTELFYELPLGGRPTFVAGIQYRHIDVNALSEAKDRAVEEILLLQEKFNKDIDLSIETVVVNFGLRW